MMDFATYDRSVGEACLWYMPHLQFLSRLMSLRPADLISSRIDGMTIIFTGQGMDSPSEIDA